MRKTNPNIDLKKYDTERWVHNINEVNLSLHIVPFQNGDIELNWKYYKAIDNINLWLKVEEYKKEDGVSSIHDEITKLEHEKTIETIKFINDLLAYLKHDYIMYIRFNGMHPRIDIGTN